MSAVWLGLSHRLKTLMGKMGRMSPVDSSGRRLAGAPNLAEVSLSCSIGGVLTSKDETKEWQNLNSLVAATASCGFGQPRNFRLGDLLGPGFLPQIYEESTNLHTTVSTFISDSANLLLSSSVIIRESVKEALGSELPLSLGRNLISALYKWVSNVSFSPIGRVADSDPSILAHAVTPNGINLSESLNVMVEQIVSVVRLLLERLQSDDPHFDLTELLFLVARYLNRLGKDDNALRVKVRFCQLVESILTREGMVATGQDGLLRNSLLEWFTEWSFEAQKVKYPHRSRPLPS